MQRRIGFVAVPVGSGRMGRSGPDRTVFAGAAGSSTLAAGYTARSVDALGNGASK